MSLWQRLWNIESTWTRRAVIVLVFPVCLLAYATKAALKDVRVTWIGAAAYWKRR